jgi:hypothetical protein
MRSLLVEFRHQHFRRYSVGVPLLRRRFSGSDKIRIDDESIIFVLLDPTHELRQFYPFAPRSYRQTVSQKIS